MNGVVECINGAGRSFVEWSAAMLVQSSVLIGILFGVDLLIRKRVRAVVRYWIWMLVLVKLVLPPSLSSPFGLGAFLPATRQITAPFSSAMPDPQPKPVSSPPVLADPSLLADVAPAAPRLTERPDAGNLSPGTRPSWQGSALMIWLVVAMTLLLLLAQRAMFVRGLVRQAQDADGPMRSLLAEACTRMGLKARPAIRLSPNAASPAVCGLWRPVILVPQDLARRLQPEQARSVLLHELAHIKRGDLWVNLIQTLLQIAYFYNPLLWLANWRIRRVREQAVDEAVLVAMRDRASEYPETLVGVARMTFARPALGLRLIGVVESKGALRGRIRHMLGRPFPKTARLGLCGLAVLTLMGVVFLPMAASQERRETDESLAWQRTDLYVPPDPNGFFPDDPEGGKRLDALFDAPDRNRRSDEEVLSTVRQGLLRTSKHKTLILQWIGNRYVWNKDPQDAQAIEILYHAVPLERHYAVYFGLSVVKDKSPNILRTLAEICMEGEEVGRVTWGIRDQKDQLLSYIRPHLQDTDPARREVAEVLVRHFAGQVNFETWKAQRELERKKVQFGDQMPQLREQLLTGDSAARRKAFGVIAGNGLTGLMDDTFLEAMEACAKDPDRRVRNEVARTAGGRWVWNAQEHSPRAVALMRVLAADEDRDVRYNAVYFGLSTVRQKDQAVIGQLVDMALKDREPNLYGRIVWGLKGLNAEQQGWLKELLLERAGRTSTSPEEKASIYDLYKATLDMAPPADFWGPREVLQGRVLDWQDQPVAGAAVVICDANSGVPLNRETFRPISEGFPQGDPSAVAFAVTDQDGRFQAGVPAGSYRLVAQSWRDAAAIKGPLEKNGEEVRLHGVAQHVRPGRDVEIRPLGTGVLVLDQDMPNDDTVLVFSTAQTRADPVLGFAGWGGAFMQAVIGGNRMPGGKTTVSGLPEGTVYLAMFAPDNAPAWAAGQARIESGKRTVLQAIPFVGSWSNARHDPPAELRPLFERFKALTDQQKNEVLAGIEKGMPSGGLKAGPAGLWQVSGTHLQSEIPMPDGGTALVKDVLAAFQYLQLQRSVEQRSQRQGRRQGAVQSTDPQSAPVSSGPNPLQAIVDAAQSGATVVVPKGTYTQPLHVSKPLTLRGESLDGCTLEVTANGPALSVDCKGQGQVTVEDLTIRWQLATSDRGTELPYALHVKDTQAVIRGCRFVPLGNAQRSPVAVRIDGFSKALVTGCQTEGFEYTVCFGEGTEGAVQGCRIKDSGHQGVTNYENSTLTVQGNIIEGSKYHAVRCTGGTLHVKDNIIANNQNSGVYLGNKDSTGTIADNLFIGNGTAVAGFYQSEYQVTHNVILDSTYAGVGAWDTCRLNVRDNVFQGNAKALVVYAKGSKDTNTLGRNTFWKNTADVENCQRATDSILADPLFQDPATGDYALRPGPVVEAKQGLTDPKIIRTLWARWKGREIKGP